MNLAHVIANQRRASDPTTHVWVSASAGSGKTTVLVARLLRLLLNDQPSIAPHRILCLTYTKAAAMEMRLRLMKTLMQWAGMTAHDLHQALSQQLGETPTESTLERARSLFAQISDDPDGLRIHTLHAFCQSILARFPLESGISPGFVALDEIEAQQVLHRAIENLWQRADGQSWCKAKIWAEQYYNLHSLPGILKDLLYDWPDIGAVIAAAGGEDAYWQHCFSALQVPEDAEIIWQNIFADAQIPRAALIAWAEKFSLPELVDFLSLTENNRRRERERYFSLFLTNKHEARKKFPTKKMRAAIGDTYADDLMREQARLLACLDQAKQQRLALASAAMGLITARLATAYAEAKTERSALDFADLIHATNRLLQDEMASRWVHYKLDGGIDHILVDEAQDTAPQQWQIIEKLTSEFFAGTAAERPRSLFVVGDPKQSIYSFQGAVSRLFQSLHHYFSQQAKDAQLPWADVPLSYSFRTANNLLALVDKTFVNQSHALHNHHQEIQHQAVDIGRMGMARIYPAINKPDKQIFVPWDISTDDGLQKQNQALAENIAQTIAEWLASGRLISHTGQPVMPKDIFILLQQRASLADALLAALHNAKVPAAGSDRLKLTDATAVQDLITFCQFLLLPQDDMNLAQLLRSPFINLPESILEKIAYHRGNHSLFYALSQSPETKAIHHYLQEFLSHVDQNQTYDLLANILSLPCPACPDGSGMMALHQRLGKECDDPVTEFLQLAQREGKANAPLSLQAFIHWINQSNIEIKREMSQQTANAVRVLTVHGAKGLEAPIVILADASELPHESGRHKTRAVKAPLAIPHFLFAPDSNSESAVFDRSDDNAEQAAEYQRLLYVAMTRAEHELHIFGKSPGKDGIKPHSWYAQIATAAIALGAAEDHYGILHYGATPQTMDIDLPSAPTTEANPWQNILPITTVKSPPRIQSVTEFLSAKYPFLAHGTASAINTAERGTIMHRLFEYLPQLPSAEQTAAAQRYLQQQQPELSISEQQSWIAEVLQILHHPEYAVFFSHAGRAEMTLAGDWQNHRLIGKLDRVVITENQILLLDFKTSMNPPDTANLPPQYVEQLKIYAHFLQEIYPNIPIQAGILWTAIPRLDWLTDEKQSAVA